MHGLMQRFIMDLMEQLCDLCLHLLIVHRFSTVDAVPAPLEVQPRGHTSCVKGVHVSS